MVKHQNPILQAEMASYSKGKKKGQIENYPVNKMVFFYERDIQEPTHHVDDAGSVILKRIAYKGSTVAPPHVRGMHKECENANTVPETMSSNEADNVLKVCRLNRQNKCVTGRSSPCACTASCRYVPSTARGRLS